MGSVALCVKAPCVPRLPATRPPIGRYRISPLPDPALRVRASIGFYRRSVAAPGGPAALERLLYCLHLIVQGLSGDGGVQELLLKLSKDDYLLELVMGNLRAAAHLKVHPRG